MNILFISNNFPPILDGVGDYTYKLAQNLVKQGFEVSILCSEKAEIIDNKEKFKLENITVLPIIKTWNNEGLKPLKNLFSNKSYDYVSLQYVPFAFQKKGLPIHLAKNLKIIFPNTNWHIMFHELWVAMEIGASLKSKIHGYVQKQLINGLIKTLKPTVINTHSTLYKYQISKLGYGASILPLFSNILKNEQLSANTKNKKGTNTLVLSLFGSIHFGAPVKLFLEKLISIIQSDSNKFSKLKFIFIGNCGASLKEWSQVLQDNNIKYEITGKISEQDISDYLSISDIGITTTPYILVEKSGTVAAMLQHHLKVICVARDWNVKGYNISKSTNLIGVENYQCKNLENIINSPNTIDYCDVINVTKQLVYKLNKGN